MQKLKRGARPERGLLLVRRGRWWKGGKYEKQDGKALLDSQAHV